MKDIEKVLVTGAGGYIGIPICGELAKRGYNIIALDRYFFGRDKIENYLKDYLNKVQIVQDDIRYFDLNLLKDVDCVIDLAGLSNDAAGELDKSLTVDINYRGAVRIAESAKRNGVKRYIYSSSASVYGWGVKPMLTEDDAVRPITEYAKSKVAAENDILKLSDGNFSVTILRHSTVFGVSPRMRFDLAINLMVMRAWKDGKITVMGGGKQWRPFVHVLDVVKAFMLVLEFEDTNKINGEIFNVGKNENNYQIGKLAEIVAKYFDGVSVEYMDDDPDKRDYSVAFEKIKDTLNYEPDHSIEEGIIEVKNALEKGIIDPEDIKTITVLWYRKLLEWDKIIKSISYQGSVL